MSAVRPANSADVPLLLPLVEQYWTFEQIEGFETRRVAAQLARLLSQPLLGAGWLAGDDDGTAIGYLLSVYVFSLEHLGLTAEIDELFVLPSQRGRGVGQALLDAAEAAFIQAGCTNVSLQISRNNDAARAFYLRHGYAARSGFELLDKALHAALT